jgi:c-di-GMP-binding flagellar brake protein YcgR
MLEANEARGRRRYVRAACSPEGSDFNCSTDTGILRGTIRDLSSVGMSGVFMETGSPKAGTRLKDLQLSLKGVRVTLNGVVVGSNELQDVGTVAVMMFEPASVNDDKRAKLRAYIRKTLQATMDKALALA